jgi:hypothetical protein
MTSRAPRGRTATHRAVPALAAAVILLAGCGDNGTGDGTDGATVAPPSATGSGTAAVTPSAAATIPAVQLSPAALLPGQAVPIPAVTPVLTLAGRIGRTNAGTALALDVPTIDDVGLHQVSLYEPWLKKTMSFRGVWLADLLDVAGVRDGAGSVHVTALDDYQVDLTMAEIRASGVFLATQTGDGAPIPVADGGPTRIVFVGGVPSGESADRWIWSLETIEVR